jgi:hypothetical protein
MKKGLETRNEKHVKKLIKAVLKKYGCYYHMPVPSGYGAPSLDFVGCHKGRFFGIEAKRPGKVPTPLQEQTMEQIEASGGATFVIGSYVIWKKESDGVHTADAYTGMEALEGWLLLGQ